MISAGARLVASLLTLGLAAMLAPMSDVTQILSAAAAGDPKAAAAFSETEL